MDAAVELFYEDGVHATGVARLAEVAHVSTRTLYQHFASKTDLVEHYLAHLDAIGEPWAEQQLDRTDLEPRERLLAIFTAYERDGAGGGVFRGCPFHNAAVEAAGTMPTIAALVARHKLAFVRRLTAVATEAEVRDPERLARQLAVLFEGAAALSTSGNDLGPVDDARDAARELIDSALRRT